jgi:hypothetical protein
MAWSTRVRPHASVTQDKRYIRYERYIWRSGLPLRLLRRPSPQNAVTSVTSVTSAARPAQTGRACLFAPRGSRNSRNSRNAAIRRTEATAPLRELGNRV